MDMFLFLILAFVGIHCHQIMEYTWELRFNISIEDFCSLPDIPWNLTRIRVHTLIQCLVFGASLKAKYAQYDGVSKFCFIPDKTAFRKKLAGELFVSTIHYSDRVISSPLPPTQHIPDCNEANVSGIHKVSLNQGGVFDLYCDVDTPEGPWTVIQQRYSGDLDFRKTWCEYKNGFGDLLEEFWIGNDIIHTLTLTERILRIEVESWNGTAGAVEYTQFQVADENHHYKISLGGFTGNIHDSFSRNNNLEFTTLDMDNDSWENGNCASQRLNGGWWFKNCSRVNLNGKYLVGEDKSLANSMKWDFLFGKAGSVPLKTSKMMVKKKDMD